MKKFLGTFFVLAFFVSQAMADTTITIPLDFLSKVVKKVSYKTDLTFIERLLLEQVVKNSSLNGIKLKNFSEENLIKYFNEDGLFKTIGENKLMEPNTGATLEFVSDNKCKKDDACKIIVDFNGEQPPNKLWTKTNEVQDMIIFGIKRNKDNEVSIVIPKLD